MSDTNGFKYFENSGYGNNRNRKRTLILDIDDSAPTDTHLGLGGQFNIKLFEPMIIDKQSEVYLDNFLTFNSNICQTIDASAFVLKINEFNSNSNVASSSSGNTIFNSLIIPNEHRTVANNQSAIMHKGKKMNYICDINSQTIHSLSGSISDLGGNPIFHDPSTGQHTYTLSGLDAGSLDRIISNGEQFTSIKTGLSATIFSTKGTFITTHSRSAASLHFSTDNELPQSAVNDFVSGAGNLEFSTPVTTTVLNPSTANKSMILIKNPGRFIAEFLIIARE